MLDFFYSWVRALAETLAPVGGAAAAIVLVTIGVRSLLHPLTRSAVRGERARSRLAPQMAELRRKHGADLQKFSTAMQELYRAERVSPFAGMLPMLAQVPVFVVLYQLFTQPGLGGGNDLLRQALFGVPLGSHVDSSVVFGVIFVALALVAWATARRSTRLMALQPGEPPTGLLAWLPRVLPYAILLTAIFVPLAAQLYLLTTTAWTLGENVLLKRGIPV